MRRRDVLKLPALALAAAALPRMAQGAAPCRGTGDLALIVERASGSVLIADTTAHRILRRVEGLGDLSHPAAVFSRDARLAFIFGRDGGLTKLDMLTGRIAGRIVQAGNSIGGAISDDGRLVAVANYKPGGVRVFDAATLEMVADIAAVAGGARSKVVGLEDAPGRRFLFSLYDAGEIWLADFSDDARKPRVRRLGRAGRQPYDALISADGRHYIAGLFGEDGLALVDLWREPLRIERILPGYGRGERKLPVYKMPHLEGWAQAGGRFFLPAIGRHEVLVVDGASWREAGRVQVAGQPVFAIARPDGRQVWVNFALPHNHLVKVIDTLSLEVIHTFAPGKAVLHMEFSPRGEQVWISVRDAGRIDIHDTRTFEKIGELPARAPSGIFFTARAHRIGL